MSPLPRKEYQDRHSPPGGLFSDVYNTHHE